MIIPGNGCTSIQQSNWYGWLHRECATRNIPSICENFPDPYEAKREIWLPFIDSQLKQNPIDSMILVGHSSGAQAALRYTEDHPVKATILVSATYSDLGDANERLSNYYPHIDGSNQYDFESMRKNCKTFHQFHSDDDPFIPVQEAIRIKDGLQLSESNFHLLPRRSHFFEPPFPELLDLVLQLTSE